MRYPNSIEIDSMTISFDRGGGHNITYVSNDETNQIVAWFEEKTGIPARQVNNAWCWQKVSEVGIQSTIRVFPVTPKWLERLPAGERSVARTVISESNKTLKDSAFRKDSNVLWLGLLAGLAIFILTCILILILSGR